MLIKISLLVSISVLCSILLMFLGWIAPNKVALISFFISLACLLFECSQEKLAKGLSSKTHKGIFSLGNK
ncbi:MAG TPA: hypothetical protein DEO86_20600 [Colwellia sp.]|nr:hypothetical protein [Colwellia sp.]